MRSNRIPTGVLLAGIALSSALTLATALAATQGTALATPLAGSSHAEHAEGPTAGTDAGSPGHPQSTPPTTAGAPTEGREPGARAATLSLACAGQSGSPTTIACTWSQSQSPQFAHYYLLKSRPGFRGRVVFARSVRSATGFNDHQAGPATVTYVVVAVDGANHVLDHSGAVSVTVGSDPAKP